MTLTAATVKREVLDPSLEGIALNLQQERLVCNPSPEVDSLVEHINALARTDPGRASDMMRLLTQLVASNQLEREQWRKPAGFADRTARHLRDTELNGGGPRGVPARQIATTFRDPLDAFAAARDRATVLQVVAAIRLLTTVPADQLLAPAVLHNLGKAKGRLLEQIVLMLNESGAPVDGRDAASHEGARPGDRPGF